MTMRDELHAIGLALVAIAEKPGVIDIDAVGDLLKRLAAVFGRYVNARRIR